MRRWGQIAAPQSDDWYAEVAASVYKPALYLQAEQMLVDEGLAKAEDFLFDADGYRAPAPGSDLIDGIAHDGHQPNAYVESLPLGLKGDQIVVGNQVQG